MAVPTYTKAGTKATTAAKLDAKVFSIEPKNHELLKQAYQAYLANGRENLAKTLKRGEVRGGGKKPWKQKGTGRARAGSNRSPLWKGGGVIFGPKPKNVVLKLNRKERRLALQTLLYNKKNNIIIIENLEEAVTEFKTKSFLKICDNCKINVNQKIVVVVAKKTSTLKSATQNLKNVELILASNLNTVSLLKAKQIILTSSSINEIKEIYCD